MSIPTDHAGRFPLLPALSHIYYLSTCEDGHSDRWDLISCCRLVGIPPVIFRDVDQLVLWPFGFFFFFFLFLKGVCEEIFPVASCFLKVGYVQD